MRARERARRKRSTKRRTPRKKLSRIRESNEAKWESGHACSLYRDLFVRFDNRPKRIQGSKRAGEDYLKTRPPVNPLRVCSYAVTRATNLRITRPTRSTGGEREFQKMASNCVHSFRGRDRPRLRTRLRTLPGESPLLSTSQWAGESLVIVDKNDPDSTVNLESLQSLLSTGRMVEKLFGFCKFL